MMVLRSTKTHNITLKNLTRLASKSNNRITGFVNYYGDGKYDRTFDSIEQLIAFGRDSRTEPVIRGHDSILTRVINAENRVSFFTFS